MKKTLKTKIALALGLVCTANVTFAKDITVWAWDPNFNVAIMNKAADIYEKSHPDVNIKVVDFAKANVEQKLQTMLASGVTSSLPDVVLIEDYNAPKYLTSYPGAFAPLTHSVDYSKFAPYKLKLMTKEGEVYGLPFDTGVTGLFYRADLLAKAGFKAEDLENITWDQLIEIGKKVKSKTGINFLSNDPSDIGLIRIMMQSAGTWYFNQDGSLNIKDNKALAESIRIFAKLYSTGITRPVSGWSEWVGTMNSGAVSAVVTGVWITPSIKSAKDQSGKWRVAPTPRLNISTSKNASNLGGSSWYVLNASDEKKTAIDFLAKTFGSNNQFYNEILTERGAVGTYLPASKTASYNHKDEFFSGQKIYKRFNKWSAEIPAIDYGLYTYEVDSAISALIPSVMQGMSIDKALADVEKQIKYQIQ